MKPLFTGIALIATALSLCSCGQKTVTNLAGISTADFESDSLGTKLFILKGKGGMEASITNYGGRIVSLCVPDKEGNPKDVTIGFDNIEKFSTIHSPYGATIGRFANRIANGTFKLDGTDYYLPQNNGANCLHGGRVSFQAKVFEVVSSSDNQLKLKYVSPDKENGFPGEVTFFVSFTVSDDNSLDIQYDAETTKPTVVNFTNHTFFNLSGDASKTILEHELVIDADYFTPTNYSLIPTGELSPVEGTAFDFRTAKTVGQDIEDFTNEQLAQGKGYDHNFVFNKAGDDKNVAAELYCPSTGIDMKVYTDQPGVQIYSSNNSNGSHIGKGGVPVNKNTGICLETQHFPDSPNHPEFPSTVLRPGEHFSSHTTYAFSVR